MPKPVVAVDDKLINIRSLLTDEGFDVVDLREGLEEAKAVVVSGMDDDLMGIQEVIGGAPVIDAAGRDAQEILEDVRRAVELH